MKLQVDNQDVFELQPWQEAVIKNDIKDEEFIDDMKRRARYIWEHKFEKCYERFEKEWLEKLRTDQSIQNIPTSKEAFVNLVISRSDYKNRSQREVENV